MFSINISYSTCASQILLCICSSFGVHYSEMFISKNGGCGYRCVQ